MSQSSIGTLSPSTPVGRQFVTLGLVLLAIFVVRAVSIGLSSFQLGFDEAQYWTWSQNLDFGYFNKPPLIAWLIRSATVVCGDGQACVRLPANLLQIGSAFLIYLLGARLYDARIGFWSAIVYALLPGIAVSSFLITTDVPLLLFWIVGLIAFAAHLERPRISTAVVFGLAVGLGFNAKYAMVYLPALAAFYIAMTPSMRPAGREPSTWLGLALAIALIVPNIVWNAMNGFVTFHHTSDNIGGWQGFSLHPVELLTFVVSQFGLAGPIVFGAYLVILATGRRSQAHQSDRLLLFFSLPILVLIALEGLRSRAHGNWAATAFPAVVVLTTAVIIQRREWRVLAASVGINGLLSLAVAIGVVVATPVNTPRTLKPVWQLFGWNEFADEVKVLAAPTGIHMIVADGRIMAAELIYTLRNTSYEVRAIADEDDPPADHFQMTRPWYVSDPGPVILITDDAPKEFGLQDGRATLLGTIRSTGYLGGRQPIRAWRIDPPKS